MNRIEERELIDNVQEGTLETLTVKETEDGYQISLRLSWKEEALTLVTQRGTTRTWMNLDRLIRHIKTNYKIDKVNLILGES